MSARAIREIVVIAMMIVKAQRYRRGQLLAVGANAMGLAQSVGLLLSTDRLVERALGKRRPFIAA
jgi:hypothetical protein